MKTAIIGLIVVLISTIAGWFLSAAKKVDKPVKVMLFVLYFWLFAFFQLIICALLYYFGFIVF